MNKQKHRHSESIPLTNQLIYKILHKTHLRLAERRYEAFLQQHELPLKYTHFVEQMGKMTVQEHSPKMLPVVGSLVEPDQSQPIGLHYPVPQVGKQLTTAKNQPLSSDSTQKGKRKKQPSIRPLNQQRPSIEVHRGTRNKSNRMQSESLGTLSRLGWSRRKLQKPKLIPLEEETETAEVEEESKISQMRQRKIKYEQVLRAFKTEELADQNVPPSSTRKCQGSLNFTTDFKGKAINFCPSGQHLKADFGQVGIKVHTLVQSGREWGRGSQGKYLNHASHQPEGSMFI